MSWKNLVVRPHLTIKWTRLCKSFYRPFFDTVKPRCYIFVSVRNYIKELRFYNLYRRISVTLGSGIAGCASIQHPNKVRLFISNFPNPYLAVCFAPYIEYITHTEPRVDWNKQVVTNRKETRPTPLSRLRSSRLKVNMKDDLK